MRNRAEMAATIKADHEGEWVHCPGPLGRGGVRVRWRPGVLQLRCEGYEPPMKRTIRRWCEAFGMEWRPEEGWEYEGSCVTVRDAPTGEQEE